MLFRAVIRDHGYYRCFSNIISTLSKNSKECVLNIRPDDLIFIIREESKRSLPLIWCEFAKDSCFAEFSFRGVTPENNQIVLLFNPTFLAKALASVKTFEYVKFKLAKIQENSFLSIDVRIVSMLSAEKKHVLHDIPVKVILPQKWSLYCLPELPKFRTVTELPNIRHIMDKFKILSPFMNVFVNVPSATLHLTIETDVTTLISNFSDVNVEHIANSSSSTVLDGEQQADESARKDEVACQVETKSLAQFINSVQYPTMQKCLFINHHSSIQLRFVVKEDVVLYGMAPHVTE